MDCDKIVLLGEIMRIVNLASGSKANCTYIEYGDTKILIDVGLNEKNLKKELAEIGARIEDVLAVCITHEHVDHVRAVKALAKKYDLDFYVKQELADSAFFADVFFKEGKLHKIESAKFNVGNLEILPIDVSHDAIAPVGYVVNVFGSKSKALFLTDTGVVSESVKQHLDGVKMAFLESNYDENMLINGKYPYITKQRILGNKGHLSNVQSLELAKYLYDIGTKCFVLSHISQNNNTPEIAYTNYADYFESKGLILDKDVFVRLSFQERHGNNFNLKEEFDGK
jgi:phosphoribosyl 1,2-cyclic phosphodiesterase